MDDAMNIREMLESGDWQIVLDTNVLLNIYLYSPEFTEFALNCLKIVEKWVILPATVRLEYGKHCGRAFSMMEERIRNAGTRTTEQIDRARDKVLASCKNFERLRFPDVDLLKGELAQKFDELSAVLEDFFAQRSSLQMISHSWDGNDFLLDFVSELGKAGAIMPPVSQEDIYRWCEEGANRYKKEIPPGFEDAKNKDGVRKYSDLILWKETLRYASTVKKNIVFVTDDVKADWWEAAAGCRKFHSKLLDEFHKTGMELHPFVSSDFYKAVSAAFHVERPDAVEMALRMTDEDYCSKISEDVLESVFWKLAYDGTSYVDENNHIGSEGIDELELTSSEFLHAERVNRKDNLITYCFQFLVTLEGTSYEYWGRDDETKEVIKSPGVDHVFEGTIDIEVSRSADIFLDFESDDGFESAKIIGGHLEEVKYFDRLINDFEPEPGELGFCPDCGCPLNIENDGGNGFCVNCAPRH